MNTHPRRYFLAVHRYLALVIGLFFVVVGITGSINVFRWDIDEWLNPKLLATPAKTADAKSLDEIFASLRTAYPDRDDAWSLEMPRHPKGMLTARYFTENAGPEGCRLDFIAVNPYTGERVAKRCYADFGFLITWIYDLHSCLLRGDSGAYLVGGIGLLLTISVCTGLWLWLPARGKLRQALTIKRGASATRLNYDVHKVFGIYGAPVLLMVAFTGTCMIFSDYVKPLITWFSPVTGGVSPQPLPAPDLKSNVPPERSAIPLSRAVAIARQVFPDAQLRFVITPRGRDGFYGIQMRQPDEASLFFTATMVWVDQYSGKVLGIRNPNAFTAGETFLNLLWALHNGEALGMTGRCLVCVSGLIPLILYMTGIFHWLKKRRAKGLKENSLPTLTHPLPVGEERRRSLRDFHGNLSNNMVFEHFRGRKR